MHDVQTVTRVDGRTQTVAAELPAEGAQVLASVKINDDLYRLALEGGKHVDVPRAWIREQKVHEGGFYGKTLGVPWFREEPAAEENQVSAPAGDPADYEKLAAERLTEIQRGANVLEAALKNPAYAGDFGVGLRAACVEIGILPPKKLLKLDPSQPPSAAGGDAAAQEAAIAERIAAAQPIVAGGADIQMGQNWMGNVPQMNQQNGGAESPQPAAEAQPAADTQSEANQNSGALTGTPLAVNAADGR